MPRPPLLQTASRRGELRGGRKEKWPRCLSTDATSFPWWRSRRAWRCPAADRFLPRINGSRPRTNEYLYDGISVLQPEPGQVAWYPVIDGIAEFKLNINSYSPEYGRSNGGTVMVVGKSRRQRYFWHARCLSSFATNDLNARALLRPAGPRPEFRRNQYGLAMGGPVGEQDLLLSWTGRARGCARPSRASAPSPPAAQQQGLFSTAIYDPATSPRQLFPGNTIPASRSTPSRSRHGALPAVPTSAGAEIRGPGVHRTGPCYPARRPCAYSCCARRRWERVAPIAATAMGSKRLAGIVLPGNSWRGEVAGS